MIYLDNNATTKPNKGMLNSVIGGASDCFGNPSSQHFIGRSAKDSIEESRESLAEALGVKKSGVIFTSGGTESNNLILNMHRDIYKIGSAVEHKSVLNLLDETIPVSKGGQLDFAHLKGVLERRRGGRVLLSIMMVNNETGAYLDPDDRLAELKNDFDFLLHVDAVQAFGKDVLSLKDSHIDFATISGHKVHALKGVGALYIDPSINCSPVPTLGGGPQEMGFRPGTENTTGAMSLGYMADKITSDAFYIKRLSDVENRRNFFEDMLKDVSKVNGEYRNSNTSNLYFESLPEGSLELFLELLSKAGVCASGQSACSSGMPAPSHVLESMFGSESSRVSKSVRFSLSVDTTSEEITNAVKIIKDCLTEVGDIHG